MTALEHLLHVILPHSAEPHLLMIAGGAGWTLPSLPLESPETGYDLYKVGMALQVVEGCAAAALHSPYYERKTDEQGHRVVIAAENRDPSFQPAGGARWISRSEIDGLMLTHEYLRPVLKAWFHEQITGEFPPERAPWTYPGWIDRAHGWIAQQVAAQGWRLTGPIEYGRKWSITCVLKAPTDAGMLFFKAVPPALAREIRILRFLAERHPDSVPAVVAAHEAEGWMLMRDFGGALLGDTKELVHWERTVRDYAAIQRDMMRHTGALLERGALDYRLETLSARLDAMLADETLLRPDRHITAEEIEQVRQLRPRIKAMIGEVAADGLLPTIVHSDFHVWNITLRDGQTIFFDWTDASVGHPFFDMASYFDIASREIFTDQPEVTPHLRDLYLEALTGEAPTEAWRAALARGETVGLVQQAVNYHHLLAQVVPSERWALSYMTYLVKQLLTRLDDHASGG